MMTVVVVVTHDLHERRVFVVKVGKLRTRQTIYHRIPTKSWFIKFASKDHETHNNFSLLGFK